MTIREVIESGDLSDVLSMLDAPPTSSRTVSPELIGERDGMFAVAVHADPSPDWVPDLLQVIVTRDDRIVELRDYGNRADALAALETSW